MEEQQLLKALIEIVNTSKQSEFPEHWTASDLIAKLFEEGGEFSEACMIKLGKLSTKTAETPIDDFYEAADMIICILDLLIKINPELSKGVAIKGLTFALEQKTEKWKNKIERGY